MCRLGLYKSHPNHVFQGEPRRTWARFKLVQQKIRHVRFLKPKHWMRSSPLFHFSLHNEGAIIFKLWPKPKCAHKHEHKRCHQKLKRVFIFFLYRPTTKVRNKIIPTVHTSQIKLWLSLTWSFLLWRLCMYLQITALIYCSSISPGFQKQRHSGGFLEVICHCSGWLTLFLHLSEKTQHVTVGVLTHHWNDRKNF